MTTTDTEALLDGVDPAGWLCSHADMPDERTDTPLSDVAKRNGWTEICLYTRAQVLAAVAADRAAIVAWLRAGAGTDTTTLARPMRALFLRGMHSYADAIEARAYLPTPPSQDTQP